MCQQAVAAEACSVCAVCRLAHAPRDQATFPPRHPLTHHLPKLQHSPNTQDHSCGSCSSLLLTSSVWGAGQLAGQPRLPSWRPTCLLHHYPPRVRRGSSHPPSECEGVHDVVRLLGFVRGARGGRGKGEGGQAAMSMLHCRGGVGLPAPYITHSLGVKPSTPTPCAHPHKGPEDVCEARRVCPRTAASGGRHHLQHGQEGAAWKLWW